MTSDLLEETTPSVHRARPVPASSAPTTPRPAEPPVETWGAGERAIGVVLALLGVPLGIALGAVDVAAVDTEMSLRAPAMLAALLLVGQGVLDLVRFARNIKKPSMTGPGPSIVLLILAVWLGLGLLSTTAPAQLVTLCLISAFVLFTLGWSLLRERH